MQNGGLICDANFHKEHSSFSVLFLLFIALSGSWEHSPLGTKSEGTPEFWGQGAIDID